MKNISISELAATDINQACLIDVRSGGEFAAVHAKGAINLPLHLITAEQVQQSAGPKTKVYLICQGGARAKKAANQLGAIEGYELIVVSGGTTAWVEAGQPVVRGKGVISIERQVRIGAGLLVAMGVALGYWVHPGFLGISAFVGVGLTFAGITDFCGMGLLLAKMPWNRAPAATIQAQQPVAPEPQAMACSLKPPVTSEAARPT